MEKISVEELVIDDSFINYCLNKNTDDVEYWQVFAAMHPGDVDTLREAKKIVISLTLIMQKKAGSIQAGNDIIKKKSWQLSLKRLLPYAAILAGIILTVIVIQHVSLNKTHDVLAQQDFIIDSTNAYSTKNAQQKKMVLPDGTQITLNAGSFLSIANGFGNKNREVYLNGEAVFDVTHNAKLPFIVHTAFYNVKVLGTLFNIKAYGTERKSETALLRGKVEILLKDNKKIMLSPNNKVMFFVDNENMPAANNNNNKPDSVISIKPISFNAKDSVVIETAWAQGRLEINNETFKQIKEKLERWYDVKISFEDEESADYSFTANFENETIEEVLEALKYSYHFNYKKDGKNITISK